VRARHPGVLYGCAHMDTEGLTGVRTALPAALAALALLGAAAPAPAAAPGPGPAGAAAVEPVIAATVAPAELALGASVTVTGSIAAAVAAPGSPSPAAPVLLALQADPYPYRGYTTVARVQATPGVAFSFTGLRPDRNTRLRVVLDADPAIAAAALGVIVDPRVATASRSLGPGQTLLSIRLRHTRLGGATTTDVWWYVQAHGSRVYRLAAVTPSRELAAGLLYANATIDPPSSRFNYRVCLNPAWEGAMGAPGAHGRCPGHDFLLRPGNVH
jgi:hypothetical protein